ncbi:PREDICTED: phospholysine phosphohistidine inorganic pyrophosphate phosphatase isoform X2 [Nanorana parkeri]|uniref:phospholysine phosphohistidine inorganic pyrophosphate phosphatase isoform X2 n=1 Tax=Nanorana parkeri TaxID=125878 RepID=UPI00085413B1|nr:PREDICTED: phospholysine phosphohistidine inorganic pyrophosphate phosphatase isoform X2 [Nanorana parkeri]
MASWAGGVRAVLLDVSGVLYDSGGPEGGAAIPGSVQAVDRIRQAGLKLRFCTNESQATRSQFVHKLQRFGFNISAEEVTAPGPAAKRLMQERGLRPHLLIHDDLLPEFDSIDKSEPNCVVIGDAAENFSYQNVNRAFNALIGLEKPVLISLGKGPSDETHPQVTADGYVDNLAHAVDILLASKGAGH